MSMVKKNLVMILLIILLSGLVVRAISLTSTDTSGFLYGDFLQIRDALQNGNVSVNLMNYYNTTESQVFNDSSRISAVNTSSNINALFVDDLTSDEVLTDSDIAALGYIKDYSVTETDVTQHETALTIAESQITGLNYYTDSDIDGTESAFTGWDKDASDDFSGSWNDLSDKPDLDGPIILQLTSSSYNGGQGGYDGMNTICDTEFSGSHICTQHEVVVFRAENITLSSGDAWISAGGPKYVPADIPVADCDGFKDGNSTAVGNYWHFDSNGGEGRAINCGTELKLACCK